MPAPSLCHAFYRPGHSSPMRIRLSLGLVLFRLMTIFFAAGALAEAVHSLLRVEFCEATGVNPEIALQSNFLEKWPLSLVEWRL